MIALRTSVGGGRFSVRNPHCMAFETVKTFLCTKIVRKILLKNRSKILVSKGVSRILQGSEQDCFAQPAVPKMRENLLVSCGIRTLLRCKP